MSRRDDLIALRDAVQAGKTPTNDLVWNALSERGRISVSGLHVLPAFEGSVDAALAFLGAVLPGWRAMIATHVAWADIWEPGNTETTNRPIRGRAETPARALLIATLSALIGKTE